MNQKILR
jgi:HrpA-like RNA helicase